jgi:hypothetical protein
MIDRAFDCVARVIELITYIPDISLIGVRYLLAKG